jgi:hypothetical protein
MADPDIAFWLSLIAIASLVQATIFLAGAVVLFVAARKLQALTLDIHNQQIKPLAAHAGRTLDEVQNVIRRVQTLDDEVRHAVERGIDRVNQATDSVRLVTSPLLGLVRGASAAVSVLVNGRRSTATIARIGPRRIDRNPPVTGAGEDYHARY